MSGALLFSGCAKKKTALRRIALIPSNVLMNDPAAEWMKIGIPMILQQDLLSSRYTAPALSKQEGNAAQLGAQDILRTKVEDRQGRIHLEATVVDLSTQKTTSTEQVEASSMATLIPALDDLAKRIDDTAGPFSTRNIEAAKLLATAAQTRDPESRAGLLDKAITTDPNFGMCYFLLLEMTAAAGPEHYKSTLERAKSHSSGFTLYDRVRFELLASQMVRAPLSQRSAAVDALLKVAPNDVDGLAIVSGLRFLNGDASGGVEALNKAISLSPNNPHLKAQLAEGLVQNKRFAEAEKVLTQPGQNGAALAELATVILLEGDVPRATKTADRLISEIPNPDYQTILRASWLGLTGDRNKAITLAENTKFQNANIRGLALSTAAVWHMMDHDMAGAKKAADLAAKSDNHPTAIGTVAGLLVSGGQPPAEWRQKVESSPLNPVMRQPILAYGFFLNGHYDEAAVEWRKLLDTSDGADLRARAMLAASLEAAGKHGEAQKIKVQPFLLREFADVYGAVVFGEMQRLTGSRR